MEILGLGLSGCLGDKLIKIHDYLTIKLQQNVY